MTLADFTTEGERLIEAGRREPADANLVIRGMVIGEEIVLPADTDGGPVAEGVLFRFADFVFCEGADLSLLDPVLGEIHQSGLAGVLLRVGGAPVKMRLPGELAGGPGPDIHPDTKKKQFTHYSKSVVTRRGDIPVACPGFATAPGANGRQECRPSLDFYTRFHE